MAGIIRDDINDATGYANGDTFNSDEQVREYFTVEAQVGMFGSDAIQDQDILDGWAEWVVDNQSHYSNK